MHRLAVEADREIDLLPSICAPEFHAARDVRPACMNSQPNKRKTVAVLADYMNLFAGGFEVEFRQHFEREARALDLNLMFVYGRSLEHPDPGCAVHNRIYDLLGPRRIDGVIALSSSITSYCGIDGAESLFQRYAALARCSVGLSVPGVPSIEVNNRSGLDLLLDHLILHHGHRKLAFIAGPRENVEANARYETYRNALSRHGIAFDQNLVAQGNFARRSGNAALDQLLARAGKPDVVVAASDLMALGAITALQVHGLHVARDVAVTGFDDLVVSRLGDPPLTTVSQPIDKMVELAVSLVLQQLAGQEVPAVTTLPSQFVIRQSCGCRDAEFALGGSVTPRILDGTREDIAARAAQLVTTHQLDEALDGAGADAVRLLAAIRLEFSCGPASFIGELERLLAEISLGDERIQRLQAIITRLRCAFAGVASPELEDIWHQARNMIALTHTRRLEQRRLDDDQAYHRLMEGGERFGTSLDLPTLTSALSGALLALGIDHAYVSRFIDPSQRELECFVAVRSGAPYFPPNPRFPAQDMMPVGAVPLERRSTFLAFPLTFDALNLGAALFEARPGVGGYQMVRDQVSAALRSIAMHQEILEQATLHERRIQEQDREATSKRIQSLSLLAGGVAHDLNNVLGPLVALPDLIIEQLKSVLTPQQLHSIDLQADVETIKVAALRATQTIKDLLTLGRQGHVTKEPLELNEAISRYLTADALRSTRDLAQLSLELCSEHLFVIASESHLGRAVTNLVRNALEAIDEHGRIVVRTQALVLSEPQLGFETIDPGSYAVISVTDTGRGIEPFDISRLFEPFFSNKRLNDHSGSGLGLSIVHGVVKEHGGFINVESTMGRGTTFTLYFPRVDAAHRRAVSLSDLPRGNARILVVDDEPVQLRTCRRVLAHLGYQVDTMASGSEAYELFQSATTNGEAVGRTDVRKEGPYDLVILDMLLNEEDDGLVLFNKIRALFPMQKGILASGHAPSQRVELAVQNGLVWLVKPYTRATLAQAVHAALNRPVRNVMRSSRAPRAL